MRDMRDALGALGPVSGKEPELNNLTVAMSVVDIGDIVFLTSDGISDNFDPVVGKFAMPKKEPEIDAKTNEGETNTTTVAGDITKANKGGDVNKTSKSTSAKRKCVAPTRGRITHTHIHTKLRSNTSII